MEFQHLRWHVYMYCTLFEYIIYIIIIWRGNLANSTSLTNPTCQRDCTILRRMPGGREEEEVGHTTKIAADAAVTPEAVGIAPRSVVGGDKSPTSGTLARFVTNLLNKVTTLQRDGRGGMGRYDAALGEDHPSKEPLLVKVWPRESSAMGFLSPRPFAESFVDRRTNVVAPLHVVAADGRVLIPQSGVRMIPARVRKVALAAFLETHERLTSGLCVELSCVGMSHMQLR